MSMSLLLCDYCCIIVVLLYCCMWVMCY